MITEAEAVVAESLFRKAEKRRPEDTTLLSRSPLTEAPDFSNPARVEVLADVTKELIAQAGGISPIDGIHMDTAYDRWGTDKERPCVVAKFAVDGITPQQMRDLEEVTADIYAGQSIQDSTAKSTAYIPLHQTGAASKKQGSITPDRKMLGWNIGPDAARNDGMNMGMFAHRYIGNLSPVSVAGIADWFFLRQLSNPAGNKIRVPKEKSAYQIELRMASDLSQTQMVEYMVQVSSILGGKGKLESDIFPFIAYSALLKRGLREVQPTQVRGLEAQIEEVETTLFAPLLQSAVSELLDLSAHSVTLIGPPGTGKTLLASMLAQKYSQDVFIVPMAAKAFGEELLLPAAKRKILPRLAAIYQRTQIPLVLQIDDIEVLAKGEMGEQIKPELQNMLEGLGRKGILLLDSTNEPELFNEKKDKTMNALGEPGRLGHMVHVGLPNAEARAEILDVHMPPEKVVTPYGELEFFPPGLREAIIYALASNEFTGRASRKKEGNSGFTDNGSEPVDKGAFTSRFLVEICREAKARYVRRVGIEKNMRRGLDIQHLVGIPFTQDDWIDAYHAVFTKHGARIDQHIQSDDAMEAMVHDAEKQIGFLATSKGSTTTEALRRSIAAQMRSQLEES